VKIYLSTVAAALLVLTSPAVSQVPADSSLGRLSFLIGDWTTESSPPGRSVIPGELSYHWALGGRWIEVHFDGHPPDGSFWGAVAMIRHDQATGGYVSWAFFGPGDPLKYLGAFVNDTTVRFSHVGDQGEAGIDYHERSDGTVYQRNWRTTPDGARETTLETIYRRIEEPLMPPSSGDSLPEGAR